MTFKPKVLHRVTIPFLKIEPNTEYFVKILLPMYKGKALDDKKEPATMLRVYDFVVGEIREAIAGTVLQNELINNYDDGYVGKCFEIVMHKAAKANAQGQTINLYNISEIDQPTDEEMGHESGTMAKAMIGNVPKRPAAEAKKSAAETKK